MRRLITEKRYLNQQEMEEYTGMGEESVMNHFGHIVIQPGGCGCRRYYDKHDVDAIMAEIKQKRSCCYE